MIDSEEMKNLPYPVHPLPPPIEIAASHHVPAIEGDAPVLAPLLGKFVVLEIRLRWGAARPVEREQVGMGEDVRAVVADAKWNVAHERDTLRLGVGFDIAPLLVRDPLHVVVKIPAFFEGRALLFA